MNKYSKRFLGDLYATMLEIRICEESLVRPILRGEIKCPVHLCSGQEAIAAGVCAALTRKDYVLGTHRSHGHYIAKGGDVKKLIAEIYGKRTGCSNGKGGSMHISDPQVSMLGAAPIVGGTIPLAVGCALKSKIKKEKRVTVSFFGDGATGEGVLYESLNFAALKKLPIMFVCENNFYSTHLPISECRPKKDIFEIARPFGIKSYKVNGNDVLKVFETVKKLSSICREGRGPIFIEFITYRLRGHVGADDNVHGVHTDIRPRLEIERWMKKEPINRFENFLIKNRIFTKSDLEKIEKKISAKINDAHIFTKDSPYPEKEELIKHVFKQ